MTTKYVSGNRNTSNPNDPNSFCKFKRADISVRTEPDYPGENVAGRIIARSFPNNLDTYNVNTGIGTARYNLPLRRRVNYLIGNGVGVRWPNSIQNIGVSMVNHPIYSIWQNEYDSLYDPAQNYANILPNMGVGTPYFTGPDEQPIPDPANPFGALYNPLMTVFSSKTRGMPIGPQLSFQRASLEHFVLKGSGTFANTSLKILMPEMMFLPIRNDNLEYSSQIGSLKAFTMGRTVRNFGGIDSTATISSPDPSRPCTLSSKFKCKPMTVWEPLFDINIGPIGNGQLTAIVFEKTATAVNVADAFTIHTSQIARPWDWDSQIGLPWQPTNSDGYISSTSRVITPNPAITVTDALWNSSNGRQGNRNYLELGEGEFYELTYEVFYSPDIAPTYTDYYRGVFTIRLNPSYESYWDQHVGITNFDF